MLPHLPWPHLDRDLRRPWMLFVDGENFTIQAQKAARIHGIDLLQGAFHEPDTFHWLPGVTHSGLLQRLAGRRTGLPIPAPIQSHYYTSVVADDRAADAARDQVRRAGFKPHVFKKRRKQDKSKGVDISLARDLLKHAFEGGFEYAVLLAGDQDYLPLVEELQSRRLAVFVTFFENGLGPRLRTEADFFFPLEPAFVEAWDEYLFPRLSRHGFHGPGNALSASFHAKRVDADPAAFHSLVDHVRIEVGGQSWRIPFEGKAPLDMDRNETKRFLEELVRSADMPDSGLILEAL